MIRIQDYRKCDALTILDRNLSEGVDMIVPINDLVDAYSVPGSIAKTMFLEGEPIACGGIINLRWFRGEAWLLTSSLAIDYKHSLVRSAKRLLPAMANAMRFRRVQATCFDLDKEKLFKMLGFKYEGFLRYYGPNGEDAQIYSRLFLN